MASQKMVKVTKKCMTRKKPSSSGKAHYEVKKGFEFAYAGKTKNKNGNIWYKISANRYIYSGNCKVWTYYYSDNKNTSGLTDSKNADYLDASNKKVKLKNAKKLD